jgi:hypothetical protein
LGDQVIAFCFPGLGKERLDRRWNRLTSTPDYHAAQSAGNGHGVRTGAQELKPIICFKTRGDFDHKKTF